MIGRGVRHRARQGARGWRLAAAALAVAVAVGGCTDSGPSVWQQLGAVAKTSLLGPGKQPPRREMTRAELDEIPYATIAVTVGDARTYLVPLADNDGYLNYLDSAGRGIVMLGGAVTGTQGLGSDLQGMRYHHADPVPTPTPLDQWPREFHREYQFRLRDVTDYSITLDCVLVPVVGETIEIVERDYDVVRVSETCTNARRQIVNTYWVEPDTGFIWKSVQWLGPDLGQATIEIIRPYSG
jgi:hypothetical protein